MPRQWLTPEKKYQKAVEKSMWSKKIVEVYRRLVQSEDKSDDDNCEQPDGPTVSDSCNNCKRQQHDNSIEVY
eukprot:9720376-Ditylum_brightwellii.AAC.1